MDGPRRSAAPSGPGTQARVIRLLFSGTCPPRGTCPPLAFFWHEAGLRGPSSNKPPRAITPCLPPQRKLQQVALYDPQFRAGPMSFHADPLELSEKVFFKHAALEPRVKLLRFHAACYVKERVLLGTNFPVHNTGFTRRNG